MVLVPRNEPMSRALWRVPFGKGISNYDDSARNAAFRNRFHNILLPLFCRHYLLSRGVMPAESPADLSFASLPDDFVESSSGEILDRLSESKMSESLLYCLNGNEPKDKELAINASTATAVAAVPNQRFPELNSSELDETAL